MTGRKGWSIDLDIISFKELNYNQNLNVNERWSDHVKSSILISEILTSGEIKI